MRPDYKERGLEEADQNGSHINASGPVQAVVGGLIYIARHHGIVVALLMTASAALVWGLVSLFGRLDEAQAGRLEDVQRHAGEYLIIVREQNSVIRDNAEASRQNADAVKALAASINDFSEINRELKEEIVRQRYERINP